MMVGMVSTRQAEPGQGALAVPEPALRPMDARFPDRWAARRARVYLDRGAGGTAIVIRDPRGRERRIPTGPGGAQRIVLAGPAGSGELLGSLDLIGGDGQVIARFPRLSWQPESLLDESVHQAGEAADDLAAFAAATGLPVSRDSGHHGAAPQQPAGRRRGRTPGGGPAVTYRAALPAWFLTARAAAAAAAAGLLIALAFGASRGLAAHAAVTGTYQALALACAAAVLAQPLLAGVLFARAWQLDRASARALPAPSAALSPHPAGEVSRRFLRTASLRLFPGDLVATEEGGEERWLPRSGPTGVTALVRVMVRGRPDRLELRTADGRPRAVLPWHDWFAGAGGEQALAGFAAAAGMPLTSADGKHIGSGEATVWQYRPLRFSSAAAAARYFRWRGLPGAASLGLPVVFGIFTAIIGAASPAALAMAMAAVLLAAGPWAARLLARRRLGRPVPPGGAS
jgi:hypothetical protein